MDIFVRYLALASITSLPLSKLKVFLHNIWTRDVNQGVILALAGTSAPTTAAFYSNSTSMLNTTTPTTISTSSNFSFPPVQLSQNNKEHASLSTSGLLSLYSNASLTTESAGLAPTVNVSVAGFTAASAAILLVQNASSVAKISSSPTRNGTVSPALITTPPRLFNATQPLFANLSIATNTSIGSILNSLKESRSRLTRYRSFQCDAMLASILVIHLV